MVSFYAIFTIVKYRVREFFQEFHYSIFAPIIGNLLFVIIFSTIDRFYSLTENNISFVEFLIPGLIIMIVAQESFDNPSVSIINSKQIGSFDDFLLAPLSRVEIFIGYIISQIFIGLTLGVINYIILSSDDDKILSLKNGLKKIKNKNLVILAWNFKKEILNSLKNDRMKINKIIVPFSKK